MRANISHPAVQEIVPIEKIKEDIKNNIGNKIIVRELNKNSRKEINKYEGIITSTYTNLFSISIQLNKTKLEKCFNYSGFQVGLLKYEIILD